MGISETRASAPKNAPKNTANLEQTIKNQKLLIENLTRELNRINQEKSVCNESVISFSSQLNKLMENYGSLNDKYQILNLIVNQMNAVFMLIRFNSKNKYEITWANKEYANLIRGHLTADSGLESGARLPQLVSKEDEEIIIRSFEFFIENPGKAFNTLINRIDADGKKIWLLINSVASLLNPEGEPVEVIALVLDITERIEAEEKIDKLERENLLLRVRMNKMDLTRRESEIVSWIVRGYTNKEIAAELNISPFTVDTHRKKVMKKLKLKNTAELVNFATSNNIK